jgi:hypothetical protein
LSPILSVSSASWKYAAASALRDLAAAGHVGGGGLAGLVENHAASRADAIIKYHFL